jgi:hypothetical protein
MALSLAQTIISVHNRIAIFLIVFGTLTAIGGYVLKLNEIGELGKNLVAGGLVLLNRQDSPLPDTSGSRIDPAPADLPVVAVIPGVGYQPRPTPTPTTAPKVGTTAVIPSPIAPPSPAGVTKQLEGDGFTPAPVIPRAGD